MTATVTEPTVKVGDFFVSSWGYDQTNVDFYKVVGITPSGKSVKVQQWSSALVGEAGGPQERVVPGESPRTRRALKAGVTREEFEAMDFWDRQEAQQDGPVSVETKRLRSYGEGANKRFYFTVNSYSSASLWDGEPQYQTGSGWGH